MTDEIESTVLPPVIDLFMAALLALLLETIIGSLLGIVLWPFLGGVARRANRALPLATIAVDCSAALLGFWVFGVLGALDFPATGTRALFHRNRKLFFTARFASLLLAVVFLLQLITFELRGLFFEYAGTYTELNIQSAAWTLLLGLALPAVLFFGVLLLGARRSEPRE